MSSTAMEERLTLGTDTMWLLLTGINILMMQLGFTAFETGASRAKHTKSVLFKNILDHAAGSVTWFFLGWGIFYGSDPFAGDGSSSTSFGDPPISQYSVLFQQFAFAATATTIVSGAVTGRCRLESYVFLSACICGFVYPLQAHWVWSSGGWLGQLGFLDFAGSCVVHAFGAGCALATAWLCGPRPGRFVDTEKKSNRLVQGKGSIVGLITGRRPMISDLQGNNSANDFFPDDTVHAPRNAPSSRPPVSPRGSLFEHTLVGDNSGSNNKKQKWWFERFLYQTHSMPLAGQNSIMMVVGALFLYIAWFSFNAGSSGSAVSNPESSARAAINTLLASGAGSTTYFLITMMRKRRAYNIDVACNALLSALVAITAPCGYIEPWAAVVCGVLAVFPLLPLGEFIITRVLGVDDVLSAVTVHGVCGIFGTLWLGLTHPQYGAFYTGNGDFFGVQLLGCVLLPLFGFVCACVLLLPFKITGMLAYSEDEQLLGLDLVHFGGTVEGVDMDLEEGSNPEYRFADEFTEAASQGSNNEPAMHHQASDLSASKGGSSRFFKSNLGSNNEEDGRDRQFSVNTFEGRQEAAYQLRRVLNDEDPRVRRRFRAYLKVLHAGEGVEFWDEVTKWKTIPSKKKRVREATRIINTYCIEESKTQVNLQSKTVSKFKFALQDPQQLIKTDLFDDALDELFKDLKHTFIEFVDRTPNYWL